MGKTERSRDWRKEIGMLEVWMKKPSTMIHRDGGWILDIMDMMNGGGVIQCMSNKFVESLIGRKPEQGNFN